MGLDYADQRFYASSLGRFNTADRSWHSVSGSDPQSWSRYDYVGGDPVNGNDPNGLCAVMIAGITMGPGTNWAWTYEANKLGADTAYPYQGLGTIASIGLVAQQALSGLSGATVAAYNAIIWAMASSASPVDIVAYSGGAAAFSTAYSLLTAAQKSDIGQILYISPGGGIPPPHNGQTSYVYGSGLTDGVVTLGNNPIGGPAIYSTCAHTDLTCLLGAAAAPLKAIQADGQCSNPEVFTRTSPLGVAGTGVPAPQGPTGSVFHWVYVPWEDDGPPEDLGY